MQTFFKPQAAALPEALDASMPATLAAKPGATAVPATTTTTAAASSAATTGTRVASHAMQVRVRGRQRGGRGRGVHGEAVRRLLSQPSPDSLASPQQPCVERASADMQSVPLSIPIADPSRAPLTSSSLSMLPFLIQLGLFAWFIERWVVPFSNGVPLAAVVWATIQYGRIKRRTTVEDLNKRWKHLILNKKPTTLIKPCEWLNKLLLEIWPNYMEPKLSKRFQSTVEYHSCVHHLVTKS